MKNQGVIYLTGLNGLRAIAALAVVISHTNILLKYFNLPSFGGLILADFGVTIFFVISGFLITYLLLLEKDKQPINIVNFYVRRILRIWPLYYAFILICIAVVGFPVIEGSTIFYYIFFAANIPYILGIGIPIIVHLWSIGVEEQFYLIWPWVVKFSSKKIILIILIAIFAILLLKLYARFGTEAGNQSILYRTINITRFHCMLIGALGAVLFKNNNRLFNKIFTSLVAQILSWLALFLITINHFPVYRIIAHEFVAIIALCLIMGQVGSKKKLINLEKRGWDFLGKISYGIYVYHPIVILLWAKFLNIFEFQSWVKIIFIYTGVLGFTIFISHLSYSYFEKRFLRLKDRYTTIVSTNSMRD